MPGVNGTLPPDIRAAICDGEPVLWHGLSLYPVLVRDFEEFTQAKLSITAMQARFPMPYVAMPYLSAIFAMGADGYSQEDITPDLFARLILLLTLVLRLREEEGETAEHFRLKTKAGTNQLTELTVIAQGKIVPITPKDFNSLRRIIAEQNRVELPNEAQNPELVDAEADMMSVRGNDLEIDFESQKYSVAFVCGKSIKEINAMTIRDFIGLDGAADRVINHVVYAVAEKSGFVSFKGGNPYPSWRYDKRKGLSPALIAKEAFENKFRAI